MPRVLTHGIMSLLSAALLWSQSADALLRVHLERAEKAQQQGDFQAAAGELRKAIQWSPSHAEAHARLGMVYRRLGMLPEATESLEHALRLDPNQSRLSVLLAFTYMDAGRCPDAIPILAANFEAEEKPSIRSVVGRRLAECYQAVGDEERSLTVVQKLRQIAADDPDVLQLALRTYMSLWNDAFQRLMTQAPGSPQARQITAESLEARERFAEAANEYRQILKMDPQLPGMHYKLGRMILRSDTSAGADENALVEFRKELGINPLHLGALTEIGEVHLKRTQLEEASRSFSQAVKLRPGYPPARVGLAKVLIAEKQWSKALEHLEAAQKLAPQEESVAYNLMLTYRGLGRPDDAKRAFDTFQRLKQQNQQNRSSLLRATPPQ